jgi:hypothetical protein
MKKITILSGGLLLGALIYGQLHAQDSMNRANFAANAPALANSPASAFSGASVLHNTAVSKTIARAVKDFKTRFTKVADDQWTYTKAGSTVFFTSDGFRTRAYYDARGNWRASLKYCQESQLPYFVRDVVKRTYYDLAITSVIIAEIPDHKTYIVNLEDSTTLKVIRVNDEGEMDVMQDLSKVK